MKFPKITKLLPLALALVMTTSFACAEETGIPDVAADANKTSGTVDYQLTINPFFDIDVSAPATGVEATVDQDDYTTISIATPLQSIFEVITNVNTKTNTNGEVVTLTATCATSDGSGTKTGALFGSTTGVDGNGLNIILTNEKNLPSEAVVLATKGGTATSADSPNAIAFNFQEAYTHEETSNNGWVATPTFDSATGVITYQMANGKHKFQYTVSGSSVNNSFSTLDTAGLYKATLVMSQASL